MKLISYLMRGCHGKFYEYWSALMTMTWGIFLLLPVDSFSGNPAYRLLSTYLTEEATGTVLLAIGAGAVMATFVGDIFTRRVCMFTLAVLYLFLCVTMAAALFSTYAFVPFILFFISGYMWWHYLCLGQRA